MKTNLVIVGGFLGAGKTTLLSKLAETQLKDGQALGLITNDQAAGLVDTAYLSQAAKSVVEVNGSCFCCNFGGFADAIKSIQKKNNGGLIVAEPVGSCTDLSATIMQPIKKEMPDITLAPLTVLADPKRLAEAIEDEATNIHPSAAYIIKKQFEEADVILINKIDTLTEDELIHLTTKAMEKWPMATLFGCSAKTGEGLDDWFDYVLSAKKCGTHLAEVDYDTYAEGEAVLGWLNTTLKLTAKGSSFDGNAMATALMDTLGDAFAAQNAAIGHVKVLLRTKDETCIANITGTSTLDVRGGVGATDAAELIVNARIEMSPEALDTLVQDTITAVCGDAIAAEVISSKALMPGRPNPTYHYTQVEATA